MMDPKKLGALVEEHSKSPMLDLPVDETEGESPEEVDLIGRGEELLTSMGEFGGELRESADIIVDNAMDIGADLAAEEMAEETMEAAEEFADAMPPFMVEGFAEELNSKERGDLEAIGAVLDAAVESDTPEGEHSPEMAAKVGGLLKAAAACCAEDDMDMDDEDMDDDLDAEPTEDME